MPPVRPPVEVMLARSVQALPPAFALPEFSVHDDVGQAGDGLGDRGEADGEIGASTGLQVGPGDMKATSRSPSHICS